MGSSSSVSMPKVAGYNFVHADKDAQNGGGGGQITLTVGAIMELAKNLALKNLPGIYNDDSS